MSAKPIFESDIVKSLGGYACFPGIKFYHAMQLEAVKRSHKPRITTPDRLLLQHCFATLHFDTFAESLKSFGLIKWGQGGVQYANLGLSRSSFFRARDELVHQKILVPTKPGEYHINYHRVLRYFGIDDIEPFYMFDHEDYPVPGGDHSFIQLTFGHASELRVKGAALLVLRALPFYTVTRKEETKLEFTFAQISSVTGVTPLTVRRTIKSFIEAGLFAQESRGFSGLHGSSRPSTYAICGDIPAYMYGPNLVQALSSPV